MDYRDVNDSAVGEEFANERKNFQCQQHIN